MTDYTNRVVHFEIAGSDPQVLADFYTAVFGWNMQKWDGGDFDYWMVMAGGDDRIEGAINGGLAIREGGSPKKGQPFNAFVCVIEVADVDETVEKEHGGEVTVEPDDLPGVGRIAYCTDPYNNTFGLITSEPMGEEKS